jgi:hypothetical protein
MFKLMDRLWQEESSDIDMLTYDVMETGFETGYIEFVDKSCVIAACHKSRGYCCGTFKEDSILKYFLSEIAADKEGKFGWKAKLKEAE